MSDTAINVGLMAAGNSTLTVGVANSQWIDSVIAALDGTTPFNTWSVDGLTDSGLTAAFGLFSPQRLLYGSGGISISSPFVNENIFSADDHSLTAINLAGVDANNAAFSMVDSNDTSAAFDGVAIGNVLDDDIDSAATIYLDNAQAGTYKIFDNVVNTDIYFGGHTIGGNQVLTDAEIGEYWNYNYGTMVFSSGLMQGEWEVVGGDINSDLVLHVSRNNLTVQDVFTTMSSGMASLVDQFYTDSAQDSASDNAGIQLVSRATSLSYVPDRNDAAAVLEGAAQLAVVGGVPYITNNISSKTSGLIVNHNDSLGLTQPGYRTERGLNLWAIPFYSLSNVDGMDAGSFTNGFDFHYGGAAIGLDCTLSEAFRLGLALNVGSGSADSDGDDFGNTDNEFDFFGASLYGAYTMGAFGLIADLGYTGIDNELSQDLPDTFGMGKLRGDVESNAITLGLTGKYRIVATENLTVAPHLGLRYTKIRIDDFDAELADGRKVFAIDTEDQDLYQLPLGVEFSGGTVTGGGWTVTPKLDLGLLFTMGDTDVNTRARIADTNLRTGTMNADVVDSTAVTGTLGFTAAAGNGLSLDFNYGLLAGAHQTDHLFSGMLRYEF